jgi:pimeloyl-ACP methyl ester carboxylesterase
MTDLATAGDPLASAPWLRDALARPGHSRFFDVDGASLHALEWNPGEREKPPLLFVHGFAGHAHWWDFIAPFFTDRWRVTAMELSGMGESARRPRYDGAIHTRDILGAIDALGMRPATVIAHSYSGSRVARASAEDPGAIRHAIVVDSHFHFVDDGPVPAFPEVPPRLYPDYATARTRFRLEPRQPTMHPVLFDHVARHSLKQVADGWTWKFDPNVRSGHEGDSLPILQKVGASIDVVYGAESRVVDAARAQRVVDALPRARGPIAIPGAHHHVMLDEPVALIATLRALLA